MKRNAILIFAMLGLVANQLSMPKCVLAGNEPFEKMRLRALVGGGAGRNEFRERWAVRVGGGGELAFPYHFGEVAIGLQFARNSSKQPGIEAFRSTFLYIGWQFDAPLPFGTVVTNGVEVGNFFMDFGESPFVDIKKTESELGVGVTTRFRYDFGDVWSAGAGGSYRVIYTQKRVHYVLWTIGVSRSFTTPGWLRDFLR